MQVGRFAVSSGVDVAATYDDNVAATNDDREDDITGNVGASVGAASSSSATASVSTPAPRSAIPTIT